MGDTAAFLASDLSRGITGNVIFVDADVGSTRSHATVSATGEGFFVGGAPIVVAYAHRVKLCGRLRCFVTVRVLPDNVAEDCGGFCSLLLFLQREAFHIERAGGGGLVHRQILLERRIEGCKRIFQMSLAIVDTADVVLRPDRIGIIRKEAKEFFVFRDCELTVSAILSPAWR